MVASACWAGPILFGQAQGYSFYTFAGVGGSGGAIDGSGGTANAPPLFDHPTGIVVDSAGNLYVTDSSNDTIRKITPAGAVTTFVGTPGVAGNLDGTGAVASFRSPQGPAIDSAGNIYVAEYSNDIIRKITPAGVVTTVAGIAGNVGSVNGTGTAASFAGPRAVAVDSSGNLYVADTGGNLIRKITSAGVVTTLAGIAGTAGKVDGDNTVALFNYPSGVAVDSSGNVYVADTYNHAIRKVTSAGAVSTFAGTLGVSGSADGTGTAATFNYPSGVTLDSAGNLFVADQGNDTIRKITPGGVVTTVAGSPLASGRVDGTGANARFEHPAGVGVDGAGNLYVADYDSDLIRKITPAGAVSTLAGAGGVTGSLDGSGYILYPSLFWRPTNLTADSAGNIYVADTFNDTVRKVAADGVVTTLAGAAGTLGSVDGTGTAANFNGPTGIGVDNAGNVYVADTYNDTIRQITSSGVVTTLAGTAGTAGSADGTGGAAGFNFPSGVAVFTDLSGNATVYVADYNNHTIRAITAATGQVTTLAGTTGVAGSADGMGTTASFNHPRGLAVDNSGNLYVADTGNHVIRKVTPSGLVTTLAGSMGASGSADGTGTTARFNGPAGVSVDAAGNVYVADTNSDTIRMVTPTGTVTTLGGMAGIPGDVDGVGTAARFDQPTGIAVDGIGNLFIADNNNNTIRKGIAPGNPGGPGGGGGGGSGGTGGTGGIAGGTPVSTTGINGSQSFLHPIGLTMDATGDIFLADTQHNSIKEISSVGVVTTFAGTDGTAGSADGKGAAATFNGPTGITIGVGNTLYVTDTGNGTIRQVNTDGTVTTLAGSTTGRGNQDGTGSAATFTSPSGICIDNLGNLYVSDSATHTIRMVTTGTTPGVVTTLAGAPMTPGYADGQGAAARFNNPTGLTIDINNVIYIADTYNDTIRWMTTTGAVSTLAGSPGISGAYDGLGSYALFDQPRGVSVFSGTAVYVTDTGNNSIRSVSLDGHAIVSTIAGFSGVAGAQDGVGSAALFNQPQALYANSGAGGLYVTDTGNALIRFVYTASDAVSTPTFLYPNSPGAPTPVSSLTSGGGSLEAWFALTLLGLAGACFLSRRERLR